MSSLNQWIHSAEDFGKIKLQIESRLQNREERLVNREELGENLTEAAVLLPLVISKELWTNGKIHGSIKDNIYLLLEKRSIGLSKSPGDMAFAGGKADLEDQNLAATAYREASEELGVESTNLEFISYMDEYISTSNYIVRVIVSWLIVDENFDDFRMKVEERYKPLTSESEHTVVIPLSHLLDPHNYSQAKYKIKNRLTTSRYGYLRYFDIHDYLPKTKIWGLTASMIRRFIDIVYPDSGFPDEPSL